MHYFGLYTIWGVYDCGFVTIISIPMLCDGCLWERRYGMVIGWEYDRCDSTVSS